MKESTKTWLIAGAVAAMLAFAALVYFLYPGIVARTGLDGHDLGGGALARLEPGERALAYLWLEECSHEEIAAVIGISANAVGVRLHRIRKRLKDMLGAHEEEK